jgi:hypothetical protein
LGDDIEFPSIFCCAGERGLVVDIALTFTVRHLHSELMYLIHLFNVSRITLPALHHYNTDLHIAIITRLSLTITKHATIPPIHASPVRPALPIRPRHHLSDTQSRQLPQQQYRAHPHPPPKLHTSNVYCLFSSLVRQATLPTVPTFQKSTTACPNAST